MSQMFFGNARVMLFTPNGGSAPASHPETRFTLQDGTVETYDITGTLDQQWMIDNGFYENEGWLKHIIQADIGNTVTSIGDYAFLWCSITNIMISNSVTRIGDEAFNGCSSLTSVTIPDSVTSIGNYAFYDCTNLTSVTFQGKTLTQVQEMENYPWEIEDTSIITVA